MSLTLSETLKTGNVASRPICGSVTIMQTHMLDRI